MSHRQPISTFLGIAAAATALLMVPATVRAELITFVFEGEVISTNKPGVFPIGQTLVGSYTFESTTPDGNSGNPEQGAYIAAVTSMSFTSGSYSAAASVKNLVNGGGSIVVNRDSGINPHRYQVHLQRDQDIHSKWGPNVNGEALVRMDLLLLDANQMAITSIDLPLTPPELSDFTSTTFGLIFALISTNDPGVDFTLTSLVLVQPCPWDLNGDGVVNVLDLIELVMSFGPCEGCPADFDDDGFVNVLDLIALIMNFGPCPGTPCVWDVNGDGIVDESDVQQVLANLGRCDGCPEDVNGDGVVDGSDVQAVATHFGPCP